MLSNTTGAELRERTASTGGERAGRDEFAGDSGGAREGARLVGAAEGAAAQAVARRRGAERPPAGGFQHARRRRTRALAQLSHHRAHYDAHRRERGRRIVELIARCRRRARALRSRTGAIGRVRAAAE